MEKLEISMTAGYAAGFLVPTSRGTTGGVCLEQVRPRRDDAMTTVTGSDVFGGFHAPTVASTSPGLPASAPPIT